MNAKTAYTHTLGPWSGSCALNIEQKTYGQINDARGRLLAYTSNDFTSFTPREVEQNCGLMAAAPDLFSALVWCRKILALYLAATNEAEREYYRRDLIRAEEKSVAAIVKAKGEA